MSDESSRPSARRVLVRGVPVAWVLAKFRSYEALDPPGEDRFTVVVRGPGDGGWVQVDVDPGMPLYHFHNLGMWLMGMGSDEVVPDALVLESRGPLAVSYWLVPRGADSSILHGRRADGSAYAYDLAGGVVRTEPEVQSVPQSLRLALTNRGVPLSLIDDWELLPVAAEDTVVPWVLEKEGSLLGRFFKGLFGG